MFKKIVSVFRKNPKLIRNGLKAVSIINLSYTAIVVLTFSLVVFI